MVKQLVAVWGLGLMFLAGPIVFAASASNSTAVHHAHVRPHHSMHHQPVHHRHYVHHRTVRHHDVHHRNSRGHYTHRHAKHAYHHKMMNKTKKS